MAQQQVQADVSPEEIKWVKDCMQDKMLTYLVPMGLGTVGAMTFATMKGYRLGIVAKIGLITSSYVAARLATIGPCLDAAERQFPDGTIVAARKGAKYKAQTLFVPTASESQDQMPSMDFNTPSRIPQSAPQQPSHSAPSASQQTYDDLRRRNREQYTSRRTAPSPPEAPRDPAAGLYPPQQAPAPYDSRDSSSYTDPPSPYHENIPIPSAQTDDFIPSKVKRRKVNVYGDEIED